MKVWKKLSAVTLALAVAMLLCVTAFADGEATLDSTGVAKGDSNAPIGTVLNIPKNITVTGDTSLSAVYGPTVTYKYVIAPATVTGITVDDGTNSGPVRAGILGGVTLSTAVFTSSSVSLGSGSGTATANVTATVDLTKFTAPGIYRYAITEDSDNTAALYAAGVTRSVEDAFFLDIYQEWR